jgi:hypothetical protein
LTAGDYTTQNNTSNFTSKRMKRHLLSLNGLRLQKHLQTTRNDHLNSKKSIATDISMWVGNDQNKLGQLMATMG